MKKNIHTKFLGTHNHKIDNKGRVSVPAGYRDRMSFDSDECDGLLYLRQERRYIEICEEHVIADALEYKTARMIAPFFSRLARPDESGRCIIPKEDMDFLGFHGGDKAVFFGLGASFGICAQNNWPEIEKAIRRNLHSPTFDIGKPLLGIV